MFDTISCFISEDKIEVNGETFLLGELTTDLLGVLPDEYDRMREISDRLSVLLGKDKSGETLFEIRAEMGALRSLLMKYRLFQTLAQPQQQQQDVFADDEFPVLFDIPEEYQEEPTEEEKENLERQAAEINDSRIITDAQKYREIVHDIYAFNQTMFWFIDQYLGRLKKLDKKNCAAALYDFLHNPRREKMIVNPISDDGHVFTISDPVNVQHIPRADPAAPGEYIIYEYYHIEHLQSFLKLDFYRALMAGHLIRRCKNCHKFFLLTQGFNTVYCDRPIPGRPHRNCRNQGAKNIAKQNAKDNPVRREHSYAYGRVNSDFNRGHITIEERDRARARLTDLRDEGLSGKYTDTDVRELMQPETLYKSLGIVRR